MSVYYQVFAQVHPAQHERVLVHLTLFKLSGPSMPPPSLVSVGNFHTLRRCFATREEGLKFGALLRSRFAVGPAKLPRRQPRQPELF